MTEDRTREKRRAAAGVRVAGVGLHGGLPAAVTIRTRAGSTALAHRGEVVLLRELDLRGDDRATVARFPSGREVRTVEHLLAAVVGCRAFDGVLLEIEGDEVPLADGGARAFADALRAVIDEAPTAPASSGRSPDAVVTRSATIAIDDRCAFTFAAGAATRVSIEVAFEAERFGRPLAGVATWDGDPRTFCQEIAPARTFGAAREVAALRARGLASSLPRGAVVALDVDDPEWAPCDRHEPIRHKLLDLLGDLSFLGGPLRGTLHARCPSHRANALALRRALAEGVLVRAQPGAISGRSTREAT